MSRKSDHDRRMYDSTTSAGHYGGRMFNVAVVGLSGTEKEKGCLGVGKSCLCNRFIRPQADEYNRDHISILSQPDFSGPIVNNEHWLYWGETRKCTEEGFELMFSVAEQTEFVDDACFQPFRSGKSAEPYHKRCAALRLNSAEKLMYICKNQLGIEKEYEQHYLPDGKFTVDGFLCVFDVSEIHGRSIDRQIEFTALILNSLLKTKKPVVLVTTKNDESSDLYVREAEKLVNRREFKGLIPLVETSAHENVNVDLAFWACVQRDWTKGKTKILSYQEAYQRQRDRLEIVNDAYLTLIRSNITDYRTHWNNTYSNLSQSQDFITYCDLFGQESAQQTFKRHVKKLKEEYVCRKIDMYLRRLPKVFSEMLPDLDSFGPDQSWTAVQQILRENPLFDSIFVLNEGLSWQEMDDNSETRIPFDLLQTPEAEKVFFDHLQSLLAEEHLRNLRYQFSELLRETSVVPGQPLKEIRDALKGRECVDSLPESELRLIYEEYQKILQQDARDQLNELFLERAPLFLQFSSGKMLTQDDLAAISHELSKDERWLTLDLLPQDRQLALIRHLGFLQWPIKEHCYSGQACVEVNIEAYHSSLAKRNSRNPLWNQELEKVQIKFVVIGSSAYADNLATVVKAMCPSLEQDYPRVHYEMQIVPSNESLGIFPFRPYSNPLQSEAYLCVYSSRASLDYLLKTLEHSLLSDLQYGNLHQTGLPLVLLLACTPDTSAKERNYLREEGINRAQCLQCAFFDVTSNEPHARFKSDELLRALIFLSETLIRRCDMDHIYSSSLAGNNSIPEGALNPEIRILISLMCGDPISPARFMESLFLFDSLPNSNFYPVSDHSFVTDVGFLLSMADEEQKVVLNEIPSCYVEFVVSSYHSSYSYKEELFYGNILVYWSKRQASFSNMSALASVTASMMPIQILALVENELRPSKLSHQLVAKGQELADHLQAYFRVSTLGSEMGRCISSFLNYTLQNKHNIEKNLQITSTVQATAGENFDQQSPHSVISSEELAFEQNAEEHFDSILAPLLNRAAPIDMNRDSPSKQHQILTEGIYERLPEERKNHHNLKNSQIHETFSSNLVEPPRNNNRSKKISSRYSPSDMVDVPTENTNVSSHNFFPNSLYNPNDGQLLKPSELRQRRHLNNINNNNNNNYYNLQSYPSADSLDRIYAIDPHYNVSQSQHYYGNRDEVSVPSMPAHYVYRPLAQRNFFDGNFIDNDQPPPRPASSAHVIVPSRHQHHSQHPPPYSRVAISPPPAYKIQSSYEQFTREISDSSTSQLCYPTQEFGLEPSSLAYYQRKYYPQHQQHPIGSNNPLYSAFRNHPSTSPFSPCIPDENVAAEPMIPSLTSYRGSPHSIYATTGRSFHHHQYSRSPHFHQQPFGFKNLRPFRNPILQRNPLSETTSNPYVNEQSSLIGHRNQNKKKKKKHFLKTRSSSLSHRHLSSVSNDDDDDDDDESPVGNELSEDFKNKRPIVRPRKTKKNQKSVQNQSIDSPKNKKTISTNDSSTENQAIANNIIEPTNDSESEDEIVGNEDDTPDKNDDDSQAVVVSGDGGEDESVSSNTSADDNLNAHADKYAVVSSWAYHQNSKSPTNLNRTVADQLWPPQPQSTDDISTSSDRSKAPGKLDLKKFNDLSNAIGRLNLHSPLGQPKSTHSTFDEISKPSSFFGKDQFSIPNESKTPHGRRERLSTKHSSSIKDDSESEASDSNILKEQASEISNINERIKFNSLKPSLGLGQKKSQKKRRITPLPVAPPRLPSSANSSNAVTPTSSGVGKSFTSFSSYDDSQQDKLTSASNTSESKIIPFENSSYLLDSNVSIDESKSIVDSGELRRNRFSKLSKLFSLPADNESGISVDENSIDAGSEETSISHSTNIFNAAKGSNNATSNADKAKFLKSKSIGTFSELDKKSARKAEKLEKKRIKEEERKNRKNSKETSRNRSRSKGAHSSLEDFAQPNGNPVPLFIEKCTLFIEQEGLDMEGIYRVPGNRAHVDTLLLKFDENPDINIADLDIPVNAVATALKDFFLKRLPPIFPPDSMTDIANLAKQYTDIGVLGDMRVFLQNLPNSNYQIIKHMISHFIKIVEKSSINSMDSKNIAICWWPTLLQFEFHNMDFFEQKRPHLMNFVQIMIDSYQELFVNDIANSEDNLATLSCSADELSSL